MKTQRIIRVLTALALAVTTFGLFVLVVPADVVLAAPNEINGTVYVDYDGNGTREARDVGVAGVTVTAYDINMTLVTSTVL